MPNSPSHAKQSVPDPSPELLGLIQRAMAAQQQKYRMPMGLAHALEQVAGELLADRDALRAENEELKGAVVFMTTYLTNEMYASGNAAPDHSHEVNGRWDSNGSPCVECAAWKPIWDLSARLVTNDKEPNHG